MACRNYELMPQIIALECAYVCIRKTFYSAHMHTNCCLCSYSPYISFITYTYAEHIQACIYAYNKLFVQVFHCAGDTSQNDRIDLSWRDIYGSYNKYFPHVMPYTCLDAVGDSAYRLVSLPPIERYNSVNGFFHITNIHANAYDLQRSLYKRELQYVPDNIPMVLVCLVLVIDCIVRTWVVNL